MPTDTRRTIGVKGEDEAARFLARCGYAILDKNVRTRAGEIDLVAKEGKNLVFVEVKTRKDLEGDPPQAGVRTRKQNRLGKLAHGYLKAKRMREIVLTDAARFQWLAPIDYRAALRLWSPEWREELVALTKSHGPDRKAAKWLIEAAGRRAQKRTGSGRRASAALGNGARVREQRRSAGDRDRAPAGTGDQERGRCGRRECSAADRTGVCEPSPREKCAASAGFRGIRDSSERFTEEPRRRLDVAGAHRGESAEELAVTRELGLASQARLDVLVDRGIDGVAVDQRWEKSGDFVTPHEQPHLRRRARRAACDGLDAT